MEYRAERKRLVDWLRLQMIGPVITGETLQGITPLDRYPCGKLYPVINDQEGVDPAGEDDESDDYTVLVEEGGAVDGIEETVKPRRYVSPSAVGFSFFAQGDDLQFHVRCSAARYKRIGRDDKGRFNQLEFERVSHGGDEDAITFT
jgi:hypothetical protein